MIQVIDFETTGLIDPQPVQYAEVVFSQFEDIPNLWSMEEVVIKPTKPMEWGAVGITGLTNEYLAENFDLKYEEVADGKGWVRKGVEYLVSHNTQYDLKFIHPDSLHNVKVVCTLKLARKLIDKSLCGDHKNSTLYYYLGCYKNPKYPNKMTKTHSAMTDVLMTTEVLLALLKLGNLTIEQAYKLLQGDAEKPEDITLCPFAKYKGYTWKSIVSRDIDYVEWLLSGGKIRSKDMEQYVRKLIGGKK